MSEVPLCVDLDGTLILTDTLAESLLLVLTATPWLIFKVPFWLLRGRAHLKQMLSQHVALDISLLPLNEPFFNYLKEQHDSGRKLILVTGADIHVAREMAARTSLFDEVMASDGTINLAGRHKARILLERFGPGGFDYAGNEHRDLAVWAVARRAIVVSNRPGLAREAAKVSEVEKSFLVPATTAGEWMRAVRVHQWTKNFLFLFRSSGRMPGATW
jgi:hypothetical protein